MIARTPSEENQDTRQLAELTDVPASNLDIVFHDNDAIVTFG